jgi:hypothetical protein
MQSASTAANYGSVGLVRFLGQPLPKIDLYYLVDRAPVLPGRGHRNTSPGFQAP